MRGAPFSPCMPDSSLDELVLLRHGIAVERVEGRDAADRLGDRVRTLGDVAVDLERRGDRLVYAVRIGPVDTDDEAASILARLERAGLTESHIIAADYR